MSAEIVGGWLIKLAWTPFLAYFWYNVNKEDKRRLDRDVAIDKHLDNVYTKDSVDFMVNNQNALLKQRAEHMEARMATLEAFHIGMLEKSEENTKKMFSEIADIKTNVAVISNSIENLTKGK